MGMSGRLLRPRQTIHPETADWANRVRTNGGSVSGTTLSAVDRFVKAIHAAGIRDRFYRLNLFCGNSDASLAAVRTPLYRGPSLGGTQYGNATDTNNSFVQSDYVETGTSGGLTGNETTKYLATGIASNNLNTGVTGHCSFYRIAGSVSTTRIVIGGSDNDVDLFEIQERTNACVGVWGKTTAASTAAGNVAGLKQINRSAANNINLYVNGIASANSGASVTVSPHANQFYVFAGNRNGTLTLPAAIRLGGYSVGLSMTPTQASNYYAAMQAFQTALRRQV